MRGREILFFFKIIKYLGEGGGGGEGFETWMLLETPRSAIELQTLKMKRKILTGDPISSPSALTYGGYSSHSPLALS